MTIKSKYILGIAGLLMTIAGWTASHSDQFPMVQKTILPKYEKATSAYKRLRQKGAILNLKDEGFAEIAILVKESLPGPIKPEIIRLKSLDLDFALDTTDAKWVERIKLKISFSNSKPVSGIIPKLKERIESRYQKQYLFAWTFIVFWLGIAVSVFALFLKEGQQQAE